MSLDLCMTKVRAYMKENVDKGLYKKISEDDIQYMGRMVAQEGMGVTSPAELKANLQNLVDKLETENSLKYKSQRAANLATQVTAAKNIIANKEAWTKNDDPAHKLDMANQAVGAATLGGEKRQGFDVNNDPKRMADSLLAQYDKIFKRIVTPENRQIFASKIYERETYQSFHALENGLPQADNVRPEVLQITKGMKAVYDQIFKDTAANNAYIEKATDWLGRRNNDRAKANGDGSQAAHAAWLKSYMDAYGENSLPGLSSSEKLAAFENIGERIRSGTYGTQEDKTSKDNFWNLTGSARDVALKQSRSMVSSGWEAEYNHMNVYGDSLHNALYKAMMGSSRDSALTQKFGDNPAEGWQNIISMVAKALPPEERALFTSDQNKAKLANYYNTAAPNRSLLEPGAIAKFNQGGMMVENILKQGLHILRALPTVQSSVTMAKGLSGGDYFQTLHGVVSHWISAMAPGSDFREQAGHVDLLVNSQKNDMMYAIGDPQGQPGKLAQTADAMGVLSGANRSSDSTRVGQAMLNAKFMGDARGIPFDKLTLNSQSQLDRFGLGGHMWDFIRQTPSTPIPFLGETRATVTSDGIRSAPDELVESYLRNSGQWSNEGPPPARLLDRVRLEAATKLGSLHNDLADNSAGFSGLRQQNFFYNGTDPNSAWGSTLRAMMQYKMALGTEANVLQRAYLSGNAQNSAAGNLMQTAVGMMTAGLISRWLVDFVESGKTPAAPTTPRDALNLLAGSALPGLVGEGLINSINSGKSKSDMWSGVAHSALGPLYGQMGDAAFTAFESGKGRDAWQKQGDEARVVNDLLPGHNMVWAAALYRWAIMNRMAGVMGQYGHIGLLEKMTHQTPSMIPGQNQKYLFAKPSGGFFEGD